MHKKLTLFVLALAAAALVAACKAPPTKDEKSAVDYGPKPENHEQLIREYMRTRVNMDGVISLADPSESGQTPLQVRITVHPAAPGVDPGGPSGRTLAVHERGAVRWLEARPGQPVHGTAVWRCARRARSAR